MKTLITKVPEFIKHSPVESALIAVILVVLSYIIVPLNAGAQVLLQTPDDSVTLAVAAMQNETEPFGQLPQASLRGPFYVKRVTASAYNSLPNQTDDTPFITASGSHVRDGIIAANFLPIGTLVTIPDVYGDKVFVVEDRMNARYQNNIDIWMESYSDAKQFGRRNVDIRVYTGE